MFNLAQTWDKCSFNPIDRVKFYQEEPAKERILSEKEEASLLKSSPEHIMPILITALNTGMRYGEIINLNWNNIDFESRYIHITNSKTGKDRKVPINEILYKTLKKQKSGIFVSQSVSHTDNLCKKSQRGRVVKLADTTASKAVGLTSVGVQVPPRPDADSLIYRWKTSQKY
jgi:integrase